MYFCKNDCIYIIYIKIMARKFFFTILMLFCFALTSIAQSLGLFINDVTQTPTNVRNAPNGKIVAKLPVESIIILTVESPTKGWWKISNGEYEEVENGEKKLKGSTTGYWLHSSVLGISTRNYGGQRLHLRKSPSSKSASNYSFTEELILNPVDIKGTWVKVKTIDGKHIGWIEIEWLCGNPLTNCC